LVCKWVRKEATAKHKCKKVTEHTLWKKATNKNLRKYIKKVDISKYGFGARRAANK